GPLCYSTCLPGRPKTGNVLEPSMRPTRERMRVERVFGLENRRRNNSSELPHAQVYDAPWPRLEKRTRTSESALGWTHATELGVWRSFNREGTKRILLSTAFQDNPKNGRA